MRWRYNRNQGFIQEDVCLTSYPDDATLADLYEAIGHFVIRFPLLHCEECASALKRWFKQRRIPGKLWRLSTQHDLRMSALFNLLDKIKVKPSLYLGTASITHLRMFIVGYRFARSEMAIPATDAEHDFYKNFQPWLQNRLSIRTVNAWDKIILLTCIDEKAAFDYFFQLLEEFLQRDPSQDIDPILVESSAKNTEQAA